MRNFELEHNIASTTASVFGSILKTLMQNILKLVVAFGAGAAAAAGLCLYYGQPLDFALLGGLAGLALYNFVRKWMNPRRRWS